MKKTKLPDPLDIIKQALTRAGIDNTIVNLASTEGGEEPNTWTNKLGTGMKYDAGKAPISLIDRHAIEEIAAVLAFGANKYAAHNWRNGISYSRLIDAALRHLFAFADGEDNDPESNLSHIAHAGCCVVFLLGMIANKPEMDDRYKA